MQLWVSLLVLAQGQVRYSQFHRRTTHGDLCAPAFAENQKVYTTCTTATNPEGVSGMPWCYVADPNATNGAWGYCAAAINYDALRAAATQNLVNTGEKLKSSADSLLKLSVLVGSKL